MTADDGNTYARLPADLLNKLLQNAPAVAVRVRELLEPALEQQAALRSVAEENGLILVAPAHKAVSLCAVDGGFAVERTIAVDIVMAVSVGVEGFAVPGHAHAWTDNQFSDFQQVMLHNMDNERLARASMVIQETAILADAPHDIRIYDGSHVTPIIQLNSGLSSRSEPVNTLTVDYGHEVGVVEAFTAFASNPAIVAMPKYDSSNQLARKLSGYLGLDIPGDDKYVTSLILNAGEYTLPQQVESQPWGQLHLQAAVGTYADRSRISQELRVAIAPLKNRELYYTYWKPSENAPTYRLELKPALALDAKAMGVLFASLERQMAVPFVREPYPQYLADLMAKSIGLGLNALQAAAHLSLTREKPEIAHQLVHSYRTEGK
jgi:hypothetical protein